MMPVVFPLASGFQLYCHNAHKAAAVETHLILYVYIAREVNPPNVSSERVLSFHGGAAMEGSLN